MRKDQTKIELIQQILQNVENNIKTVKQILAEMGGIKSSSTIKERLNLLTVDENGKIIEGIFDGQMMIGADGNKYPVPANYASKSKLVVGDALKLTIAPDGTFIYKQIGPVKRKRLIGTLLLEDDTYKVVAEGKIYNVLLASVTYFKAKPNDQVTILVPQEGESEWAAIENVIPTKKEESTPEVSAETTLE